MDSILNYLINILHIYDKKENITYQIDNTYFCDIIINGNNDGKGIIIDNYILTLSHIVTTNNIIYVNRIKYTELLNIDFYDICIFTKDDKTCNNDIYKFLVEFKKFIEEKCILLQNNTDFIENNNAYLNMNNKFYELIYEKIENTNLKSYIYPSIPMYLFNFKSTTNNNIEDILSSGISGTCVLYQNKYIGLIVSQNKEKFIEIIPFEIIYDIIKNYIINSNNFYYIPLLIKNNINQNKYKKILKNDYITKINNKLLINDKIFIDKYKIFIPYQTYILLYCNLKNINIEIKKKYNNNIEKINIDLNKYNFDLLFLNHKDNFDSVTLFNITFKELSEEFLVNNIKDICTINYDKIYNKKKLIYIEKIEKLDNKYVDIEKNVYLLNKISGHKINKLNDITKYMNNKQLTLELIDPYDNIIKLKL